MEIEKDIKKSISQANEKMKQEQSNLQNWEKKLSSVMKKSNTNEIDNYRIKLQELKDSSNTSMKEFESLEAGTRSSKPT